jgi:hypothetical protein
MSTCPKCLPFWLRKSLKELSPAMQRAKPAEREDVCRRRVCLEGVPSPIDGLYPYPLAVRDLASGQQLLWQPVTAPINTVVLGVGAEKR